MVHLPCGAERVRGGRHDGASPVRSSPVLFTASTMGVPAPSRIGVIEHGEMLIRWNRSRWTPVAIATAAFAMGRAGIGFIENLPGFEAYLIDRQGVATMTSRFKDFTS